MISYDSVTVALIRCAGSGGSFRTQRAPDAQSSHFPPSFAWLLVPAAVKAGYCAASAYWYSYCIPPVHPVCVSTGFFFSIGTVSVYLETPILISFQ